MALMKNFISVYLCNYLNPLKVCVVEMSVI